MVIRRSGDQLTANDVEVLKAIADEFRERGDSAAADDFVDWSEEAHAVRAWTQLVSEPPQSTEHAHRMIRSAQPTERFVAHRFENLTHLIAAVEGALVGDDPALDSAAEAVASARLEATMLELVADCSDVPSAQATSLCATGLVHLAQIRVDEAAGDSATTHEVSAARDAFTSCMADQAATPSIRCTAAANLAWLAARDDPSKVDTYFDMAEQILTDSRKNTFDDLTRIRRERAKWASDRSDPVTALDCYERNIAELERQLASTVSINRAARLVRDFQTDYGEAVFLALSLGRPERALELAEAAKARAFVHGLQLHGDGEVNSDWLRARRDRIEEQLHAVGARARDLPEVERKAAEHRVEVLILQLAETEERLLAERQKVSSTSRGMCTAADIAALAPPDGVIVSYFWTPGRLAIFVVDRSGLVGTPVVTDVPLDEGPDDSHFPDVLVRLVFNVRMTLGLRGDFRALDQLQRSLDLHMDIFWPDGFLRGLHDLLIAPVKEFLTGHDTVVVLPHAYLRGLPFHALIDDAGGALVDHHALSYSPSAAVLAMCRARPRTDLTAVFAAGTREFFDGPATAAQEAEIVAATFGQASASATLTDFQRNATKASIVHLACHHDYTNLITAHQGLALEDGTLSPRQIVTTSLNANLVTLSACATAMADMNPFNASEMAGLLAAFMKAGVPLVAATLWPLSDRVATLMMKTFYERIRAGATPAKAVQAAQRAIKEVPRFAHPYFWAPLTLWGDATR